MENTGEGYRAEERSSSPESPGGKPATKQHKSERVSGEQHSHEICDAYLTIIAGEKNIQGVPALQTAKVAL